MIRKDVLGQSLGLVWLIFFLVFSLVFPLVFSFMFSLVFSLVISLVFSSVLRYAGHSVGGGGVIRKRFGPRAPPIPLHYRQTPFQLHCNALPGDALYSYIRRRIVLCSAV